MSPEEERRRKEAVVFIVMGFMVSVGISAPAGINGGTIGDGGEDLTLTLYIWSFYKKRW